MFDAVIVGCETMLDTPQDSVDPEATGSGIENRRSWPSVQGNSNAEVAALTYLSPNTVKSYIRRIYQKWSRQSGRANRAPRRCGPAAEHR